MADMMGIAARLGKMALAVLQMVLAMYALTIVAQQRDVWKDHIPKTARLYDINHEDFWGPLHIMVPAGNCTASEDRRLQASVPIPGKAFPPSHDPIDPAWQARRLDGVEVTCGSVTTQYEAPTGSQNYFAMMFLSRSAHGEEATGQTILDGRMLLSEVLIAFLWINVIVDFLKAFLGRAADPNYIAMSTLKPDAAEQQWPKEKSWSELCGSSGEKKPCMDSILGLPEKACKLLVAMLKVFPKAFNKFLSQLMVLSLFAIYAEGGHYILSYVPGVGYILLYALLFSMLGVSIFAIGAMSCCGEEAAAPVMCCYGFIMCYTCAILPIVTFPFYGYNFYIMNFLWATHSLGGNRMEGSEAFVMEWPGTVDVLQTASQTFFKCNVIGWVFEAATQVLATESLADLDSVVPYG